MRPPTRARSALVALLGSALLVLACGLGVAGPRTGAPDAPDEGYAAPAAHTEAHGSLVVSADSRLDLVGQLPHDLLLRTHRAHRLDHPVLREPASVGTWRGLPMPTSSGSRSDRSTTLTSRLDAPLTRIRGPDVAPDSASDVPLRA